MFDTHTGDLIIESCPIPIGPRLTRQTFLASPLARGAQAAAGADPHRLYIIGPYTISGLSLLITLEFYGEQLEAVQLYHPDPALGTSWDDWSEEKELRRKAVYDRWLAALLGRPSGGYPWGEVGSTYDHKGGFSSIVIRYSWQGKPWHAAD